MTTYAKISGTGSYLPEKIITNADLEKMVDTTNEWIMQRVGIRERHVVSGDETTCTMATKAAQNALAAAGLKPNDIEMIVVGTATPDQQFPSAACTVQGMLGIDNECAALDVNAACAGFIYAMSVADQYIRSGMYKKVLVIGVDSLSKMIDWTDRSICILFGDGAGAVVLEASEEPGILATHLHASGKHGDLLYADSAIWSDEPKPKAFMEGSVVFKLAVTKLGEIVNQTMEKAGMEKNHVDWLIPHQANFRIISAIAKMLNLPIERVVLTVEEHGNTSAASVPLALDHAVRKGMIKRGENLLLEAFGAGLAWGSALVKY